MPDDLHPPSPESRTALVVDDDEPFRLRLVRALCARGMLATGAADYKEAMALARIEAPECAVVDLRLPGPSGLDLVRDLKALEPAMVVVILTGYGSIATAVQGMRLGATSYLTKPVDGDQVVAALGGEPLPGEAAPVAQPLARVEWEHIQRVLGDCGGNVSQAARVLGIHRRSLQRKLSRVPRAREPVNRRRGRRAASCQAPMSGAALRPPRPTPAGCAPGRRRAARGNTSSPDRVHRD